MSWINSKKLLSLEDKDGNFIFMYYFLNNTCKVINNGSSNPVLREQRQSGKCTLLKDKQIEKASFKSQTLGMQNSLPSCMYPSKNFGVGPHPIFLNTKCLSQNG